MVGKSAWLLSPVTTTSLTMPNVQVLLDKIYSARVLDRGPADGRSCCGHVIDLALTLDVSLT